MGDVAAVVIDASAAVELLFHDPGWRVVEQAILGEDAYAPDLLDVEVLQTVRRVWAAGRWSTSDAEAALTVLADLPIVRVSAPELIGGAWRHRANLSAYDACYLALAERLDGRLLTGDSAFAGVPRSRVSIEMLPR
jgi:predicted nucleic acid-binding protein